MVAAHWSSIYYYRGEFLVHCFTEARKQAHYSSILIALQRCGSSSGPRQHASSEVALHDGGRAVGKAPPSGEERQRREQETPRDRGVAIIGDDTPSERGVVVIDL